MRFLVDAQLPPALARKLEALGHVAEHVADQGMASQNCLGLSKCSNEENSSSSSSEQPAAFRFGAEGGTRS